MMATEKAKLVYDGKKYYEKDIKFIGEKEAKFMGAKYLGYRLNRDFNILILKMEKNGEVVLPQVPFGALKMYNIGTDVSKYDVTIPFYKADGRTIKYKKGYQRYEIMEIGNLVASSWGASCYDYENHPKKGYIDFSCVEHGEDFTTQLKYYEFDNEEYAKYGKVIKN